MRRAIAAVLSLAAILGVFPALAAPGKSSFDFDAGGRNVRVWSYEPLGVTRDAPIVFVLHGVLRNGEEYRAPWIPICDERKCIVLVPEFSEQQWPGSRGYHMGNVHDGDGKPVPEADWAYTAIDGIFENYRVRAGNRTKRYFIFGHSAGAQFLHRLVMLRPDAKYEVAVAANAGAYAMPDLASAWPFGLGGGPASSGRLKRALARRLVVQLGEVDNDPNAPHLPRDPRAMEQGATRLARGHTFFEAAARLARQLRATFAWTLELVPGVGHDNKQMAPAAAKVMFGGGKGVAR